MAKQFKITPYHKADEFESVALPFYELHEVENNLSIAILNKVVRGEHKTFRGLAVSASSSENSNVEYTVMIFLQTPPFNGIISILPTLKAEEKSTVVELVIKHFLGKGISLPGVNGRKDDAILFSNVFKSVVEEQTKGTSVSFKTHNMRLYSLEPKDLQVKGSNNSQFYHINKSYNVSPTIHSTLVRWSHEFDLETMNMSSRLDKNEVYTYWKNKVDAIIKDELLYILVNEKSNNDTEPEALSMCAEMGRTKHTIRLAAVYTPADKRGNGYASAVVSKMCEHVFKTNKDDTISHITLFTDLANPTSNKIYQQIGFKPLCDFENIDFV